MDCGRAEEYKAEARGLGSRKTSTAVWEQLQCDVLRLSHPAKGHFFQIRTRDIA
jgi:hypothetical protein